MFLIFSKSLNPPHLVLSAIGLGTNIHASSIEIPSKRFVVGAARRQT